jgi:hypothetical protein
MRAKNKPKYVLVRKLAGHSAMGASLGMLLALLLLNAHVAPFNELATTSSGATMGGIIGSFVISFALGALLTGFTFIMDEESRNR